MKNDKEVLNWIIGPVGRAISYIVEETKVASTLQRSLMALEANEKYLHFARKTLKAHGATEAVRGVDYLLAEAPSLSKTAAELRQDDFEIVNSHSFIAIWGALEVAIEDTICLILEKDKDALDLVASAGIKTSTFESRRLSEDDAGRLYRRIENHLRKDKSVGEAYSSALGMFGIEVNFDDHVLATLQEANSVRNCLLHCGGIIDEKAAVSSAALRSFKGEKIRINQARYLSYYNAVAAFLKEMLRAVSVSPYIRVAHG